MNPVNPCPEEADLQRFALGEVSDQELLELERHLEQCARCAGALQTLHAEDTLSESLRAQARAAPPDEERVEAMIRRLETLRLPVAEPAREATVSNSAADHSSAEIDPSGPRPGPAGDPTAEAYDFLAPPQGPNEIGRLGPYRVLGVLGAGGMGVVFRAEDPQLHRLVALKVLLPRLAVSATARERFLREARTAAAVEHDHVVHINHVGEERGIPFLVMPLLRGENLEDRLKREGRLPPAEALRIGREVAEGLAAAHDRGLVHRDVKPANLWLEGERARVKVLDFGLARAATGDAQLTRAGAVVGTPAYMAPEQVNGLEVDARSDLFSLGCVLYRLCTGRPPFVGKDPVSTMMAVAAAQPPSPQALNPAVPQPLSDLVMRLLAKEPAARPQSAAEVVLALRNLEADRAGTVPVRGCGSPAGFSGRRRLILTGVAVLALVSLVVTLGVIVIRIRDRQGKETRIEVPDENTVQVEQKGKVVATVAPKAAVDEAWLEMVATLPPEQQANAVAARLKARNPGFDGKVTPTIEDLAVTGLQFRTDHVTDVSPLRALPGLKALWAIGSAVDTGDLSDLRPVKGLPLFRLCCGNNPVADLTPLKDMKLTELDCRGTQVSDLSPLRGMPLTSLVFYKAPVSDLSPLKGMKLSTLDCSQTKVADLSAVTGMPLKELACGGTTVTDLTPLKGMKLEVLGTWDTKVADLSPLRGMKLKALSTWNTPISDLSPLEGMPLTELYCGSTRVADLTPLKGMPLKVLVCDFQPERDTAILRAIPTLEQINGKPAAQFWKEVGGPEEAAWIKSVAALPAEKQVEAVAAELKRRNPGFDGKVEPRIEGDAVTGLKFVNDQLTDLTPIRALPRLAVLICDGAEADRDGLADAEAGRGRLADLEPLRGLPLTSLSCSYNPRLRDLGPLRGMKLNFLGCAGAKVADLSPLRGMPLTSLVCSYSGVADLAPLEGMPLTHLNCCHTAVRDLSPLRDMPLTLLVCGATRVADLTPLKGMALTHLELSGDPVADLSPLEGMPLRVLHCQGTKVADLTPLKSSKLEFLSCWGTPVRDLSPLKGLPLRELHCHETRVTDLTPLKGVPLKKLTCDFRPDRDAAVLRSLPALEEINGQPAAQFWMTVGAHK